MDYCAITFVSTYGAIYAQKMLTGKAPFQVMPVLREISLGCGISLRIPPEHVNTAQEVLAISELKPEEYAFYGITGSGSALRAEPMT